MKEIFPGRVSYSRDRKGILSVEDHAGQGKARCRKARQGFASPLSLILRFRFRNKGDGLLFNHSISSSGPPRLLVAFSRGAGSRIPHLMSDRSKVVLQVLESKLIVSKVKFCLPWQTALLDTELLC